MSVDLSILVRNDFHQTNDLEACRRYIQDAIEGLKRYFLSEDIIDDLRLDDEYELNFYLKPLDHVRVHLHKGCWEIETGFSYARYFVKDENNRNFLRRLAFDCARAFGQTEAWITDEHHGWFGVLESVSDGFDEWIKSRTSHKPELVIEYNPDDFPNINSWNDNYGTKYHDNFDEPKKHLDELSKIFPEYELLTICPNASIILGKKDGNLFALDIEKGKPLVEYPIDGINAEYNQVAIEIYKNGESALFDRDGEQLTPFGDHDFSWSWDRLSENAIRVTDSVTNEYWTFPI